MTSNASGLVERPAKTVSPYGKEGAVVLRIHAWSQDDRTTRAMKRLLLLGGAAIVAVIVPPHWPWLLLMLAASPISAWLVYRQPGTVQEGSIPCPDCGAPSTLEEQPESWPMSARCKGCYGIFSIELPTDAPQTSSGRQ